MKCWYQKGFTIVEISIVLAVVSVLALITIVANNQVQMQARDMKRKNDMVILSRSLEAYYDTNGEYPESAPSTTEFNDPNITRVQQFLPNIPSNFSDPNRKATSPILADIAWASYGSTYVYAVAQHLPTLGYSGGFSIYNQAGQNFGCSYSTPNLSSGTIVMTYLIGYYSESERKAIFYWGKNGSRPTTYNCAGTFEYRTI